MALKTKQVGKYTVSQFGTLANVRGRLFRERVEPFRKVAKEGEELSDDDIIFNMWLDEYAGIASLVQPLITLEEYSEMSVTLYKDLNDAIEEVNAQGFADINLAATPEQAKKKRNAKT